jgi:dienelactone hydrolase
MASQVTYDVRRTLHGATQPLLALWKTLRAAGRTVTFVLCVLPMLPSRPVRWLTREPRVTPVRYPTRAGEVVGDLYLPGTVGPHPALLVCLGVVPIGVDHPQVPRLGRALARAGYAALMYWSPTMRDTRLDPDDAEDIALAYGWLTTQPAIDATRSGLLGTCVGGSFALLAAAHPLISERVAFVVAWAPYGSMWTLARDIASASTEVAGRRAPWRVDQLTRKVFVRSLTAVLPAEEADSLRAACAERGDTVDSVLLAGLSDTGRALTPLLTAPDAAEAEAALSRLPDDVRARLDALSPCASVASIGAPLVILAHDYDDEVIPIGESLRLRVAIPVTSEVRYTAFAMFKHLDPSTVKLPVLALTRELAKFCMAVYPVFRQVDRQR